METEQSLELRLSKFNDGDARELSRITSAPKDIVRSEYWKYDDIISIRRYINANSLSNTNSNSSGSNMLCLESIRKEPMKLVVYGIKLFGNEELTKEIAGQLTPAESLYFLAGMYRENLQEGEKNILSSLGLVSFYTQQGIKGMARAHNRYKTRAPRYLHEPYRTKPVLPHASKIGREVKFPNIVRKFWELFIQELKNPEMEDSISMPLESLADKELKILSKYFQREKLGEYYRK